MWVVLRRGEPLNDGHYNDKDKNVSNPDIDTIEGQA